MANATATTATPSTELVTGSESEHVDSSISALDKVERLKNPGTVVFSTISGDTFEGKLATVAALQDTVSLSDHVGEVFDLANVVTQVVEINVTDPATNKTHKVETVRIILVAKDGTAYHSVSEGVLGAVQTFLAGLGHPSTWPNGAVKVSAVEKKTRSGFRVLTIVPVV